MSYRFVTTIVANVLVSEQVIPDIPNSGMIPRPDGSLTNLAPKMDLHQAILHVVAPIEAGTLCEVAHLLMLQQSCTKKTMKTYHYNQ